MSNGSGIHIVKRDGKRLPLDINKIHKVVQFACEGLSGVSISQVEMNSNLQFYDGMRMFSSQGGLSDPAVDTHILHELLKSDIKKSNDLISHYVSIDSINEGFENMKEPDCSRVGIKFDS